MVIRGNIRGNGEQLAHYLLSGEANEHIQIVEVDGRLNATDKYLHQTMQGMSLTAELTKSQKGLYHAQINPAYSEDRQMTQTDWLKATDILAHELGLSEQRRVIVLHTKKNRTHAHVVFERYDHQTGKIIDHKFSRLAQDRARKEMERVFEHQPTPHRNQHRPELKEALTEFWHQTETGQDFIRTVHANGYLLAEGVPRHPFMVVDEHGRSFDLVRQLKGVRIKDVRQRLRHEKLIPEKEAIELMRQKQEGSSDASHAEQQRDTDTAKRTAAAFWNNKQEATLESTEIQSQQRMKSVAENFIQTGQGITEEADQNNGLEKKKIRAGEYLLNADELIGPSEDRAKQDTLKRIEDVETTRGVTTEIQSIESRQRQQRVAEQFATNGEETSQPTSPKPETERYKDTLKAFMQAEDELVDQTNTAPEKDQQRQQAVARQFTDNEELTKPELTADETEMQKLMQQQKDIRERGRRKVRRQSH